MAASLQGIDFVLAPYAYHVGYLQSKKGNWDLHFQLMTKPQWLADVYGQFDIDDVLPIIMTGFDLDAKTAADYLSSLQVDPTQIEISHPYVVMLTRIYRYLKQEGLLRLNPLVKAKYTGKRILIDGYHQEDAILNRLIKTFAMQVQYVSMPTPPTRSISRFESIEDEVTSFFNQVGQFVSQGGRLDDVVLIEPHSHYEQELKRQSEYFQIPIQLPSTDTLFSLPIVQWYLSELKAGKSEAAIWEQTVPFSKEDIALVQSFLQSPLLSQMSQDQRVDYLSFVFQKSMLKAGKYASAIQVVKDLYPLPQHQIFILGFAQGRYPAIVRDVSLLPYPVQQSLGWLTTPQENALTLQKLKLLLTRSQQLRISFAAIEMGQTMVMSPLVVTEGIRVVSGELLADHTDYSGRLGLIRREKYRYLLQRFQYEHPLLQPYQRHFDEVIQPFDYAFKPFDVGLKNKAMTLSYSAIKDYYTCGFKYYVTRVLKVKPLDQDEFYMHLGTFAHEIFETVEDRIETFPTVFEEVLARQHNLSAKEQLLFRHLYHQLYQVTEFNLLHQQHMNFHQRFVEAEMKIKVDEQTTMIGYIDKIIELQDAAGQSYLAVVDYKSGAETFDEILVPYGWSLQLPVYAWMLKQHPEFQGKPLLGAFIQHIIEKSFNPKRMEYAGKVFPKSYQLDGFVLDDKEHYPLLDKSFLQGNSQFVQGISRTNGGDFNRRSKRMKPVSVIHRYIEEANRHIVEANQHIRQGDFPINPREIRKKTSCQHCPLIDTCFRRPSDITVIHTSADDDEGEDRDGDLD